MHVALVGAAGAGKRALALRYAQSTFSERPGGGFMEVYCHAESARGATFVHVIGSRLSPTVARALVDSCDVCVLAHAHALGYGGLEQARSLLATLKVRALPVLEVETRCDEAAEQPAVSARATSARTGAGVDDAFEAARALLSADAESATERDGGQSERLIEQMEREDVEAPWWHALIACCRPPARQ